MEAFSCISPLAAVATSQQRSLAVAKTKQPARNDIDRRATLAFPNLLHRTRFRPKATTAPAIGPGVASEVCCQDDGFGSRTAANFNATGYGVAARKDYDGMDLQQRDDALVICLGSMEIWDGADLALLRDSLNNLTKVERHPVVGVDMEHVKYVPSGFFGMLFEASDLGVEIRLYAPQARVRNMLWFRKFFEIDSRGVFTLRREESAIAMPRRTAAVG